MIYIYHTRRTGGRSLIFSILSQEGNPGDLYGQICKNHQTINDKFIQGWERNPAEDAYFAWSHEPIWRVTLPEDTFTITIFRDPVERLVSHYRMLLVYKKCGYTSLISGYEWEWLGEDLLEFANKIPCEHRQRQLYMFSEDFNVDQAEERIRALSYSFHIDNYANALKEMGQLLGMNLKEYHVDDFLDPTVHPIKNSIDTKIVKEMTPEVKETLRTMLQPEYELLERLA